MLLSGHTYLPTLFWTAFDVTPPGLDWDSASISLKRMDIGAKIESDLFFSWVGEFVDSYLSISISRGWAVRFLHISSSPTRVLVKVFSAG